MPRRSWRCFNIFALVGALVFGVETIAAADAPVGSPPLQTVPSESGNATDGASAASPEASAALSRPEGRAVWTPWPLFDPYLDRKGSVLSVGLFRESALTSGRDQQGPLGWAVYYGKSAETRRSMFLLHGQVQYGARLMNGNHVVASLSRYEYGAGLSIRPLDVLGTVGLSLIDVHVGAQKWGFGSLSPRVGLSAALSAGYVRVGLGAFAEYSWRWTSGNNALLHGLTLDIQVASPPVGLPPRYQRDTSLRATEQQ